ncbi:hypothetical protein ATANTOWER_030813 [Ataeniobius toweri]|uniref:Ig-like domain-containing protein n=1 Tax=Ataeniobius toweri TaxID=208326 RepID=A0ABU7A4Y1_9TELE|nr:hypothetical protein [Ataeniobius toweri]
MVHTVILDLQVKVFPATEGQKVTLMCTTSCPLTESPAAFIWYKNRKFVYEDWSPWYQELVSSDQAVRYSCAIKGYEDLRAPEVSVAFINPDCFGVTYPKAEVCPKELKSADQPCSITYPREVRVEMISEKDFTTLTCNTSCPASDSHTAFRWYWNRKLFMDCTNQHIIVFKHFAYISCAVKNNEYLHSDDICTTSESWYKLKRNMKEADVTTIEAKGRVEHYRVDENQHMLRINNLRKNDSGEYMFRLYKYECQQPDLLEVILVVTGLKVTMTPSDVVTEGQRVTLTCSTSCPLTETTTYIWFFNEQLLSLSETQNKHVVLNPVRTLHAGNYSCAVRTHQNISSPLEALTVKSDCT